MLTPAQQQAVNDLLAAAARQEPLSAFDTGRLRALAGSADPEQRAAIRAVLRPAQPARDPEDNYAAGAARRS